MSTVRNSPRISINQLAKYMVATPSQRRRIITMQKTPSTFIVNYYEFAKKVIIPFIVRGCINEEPVVDEMLRLFALEPKQDFEEFRNRANAEAIEAFLDTYDQLSFEDYALAAMGPDAPKLTMGSVEISVRPEITVVGQYRKKDVKGALKLYFSKEDSLTDISAPYLTAVVRQFADHYVEPSEFTPRSELCQVFDVFAGRVYEAPTAIKRRFQDLEEISLWWKSV